MLGQDFQRQEQVSGFSNQCMERNREVSEKRAKDETKQEKASLYMNRRERYVFYICSGRFGNGLSRAATGWLFQTGECFRD